MWRRLILGILALIAVIAAFITIRFFVRSGSGEASAPITAPVLETEASGQLFRIVPDKSEAKFKIDELLLGEEVRVVGRTSELAGDILLNEENVAESEVGTVRVNVRTLITDNQFRNRAIRGEILESSKPEYEFSEFTPTAIESPSTTLTEGESVNLTITGDLKVRDIIAPVSFDATVSKDSTTRLSGVATTLIQREDFKLTIPEAKGVADISEEVTLELNFVAELVEE